MTTNKNGFSLVEIVVVIVILGLVGSVGWVAYDRMTNKKSDESTTQTTDQDKDNEKDATDTADPNAGYMVVEEWGLRFKIPSTLSGVQYRISGDEVSFFAKPTGYTVDYRSDYEKVESGNYPYALGELIRSTESSKSRMGDAVEGKKLGNYYYYTTHAFSSLATGASADGLYFDASCDQDGSSARCGELIQAEMKAFEAINQGDTALLNTIELAL